MQSRHTKTNPLDKKIPRNAKYENVESTIDTGSSITKYMKKLEEKNKYYHFRKDEIFKRMKVSTFVHMIVQVESTNQTCSDLPPDNLNDEDFALDRESRADTEVADEEVGNLFHGRRLETSRSTARSDAESVATHRSTLQSVIQGVGEVDARQPLVEPIDSSLEVENPFLILDVRVPDDYDQCHIITARNYPPSMLSRSFNPETNEMRSFRNAPGRIIIVYDEDERLASNAATVLVQRGYDNVFMLSGGLKMALKCFPKGLVTGTPPLKLLAEIQGNSGKTSRASRAGDTNRSVMTPKVDYGPANRTEFNDEDISELVNYLDDIWNSSSRMSTRTASTAPSRMSQTSNRRPFR